MIVVDTNILAYLFIEGNQTAVCRDVFRKDPVWQVPFLWRSEFRSVLTKYIRHAGLALEDAQNTMIEAEKLLAGHEYFVDSGTILSLTSANDVSAYDAEYICLAEKLSIKLVTTDKPLITKFPDTAVSPEDFVGK